MALREIFALLGVQVDGAEKLEKASKHIDGLVGKLKEVGELIGSSFIGEKLHQFIEGQIQAGAELKNMALSLGVASDELQRFQFIAELSGLSAEYAGNSLKFFNKALGEASTSKEAAATFQGLHVNLKMLQDDSTPLLEKLAAVAEGFGKLKNHSEKTAYAFKLFGRDGIAMLPLLSEGKEEIAKLAEEFDALGGGMSDEFVDAAKAEDGTVKLKFALTGLKSRIAQGILPTFKFLTEALTKVSVWFIKLSKVTNVLKTGFEALSLATIVGIFYKLAQVLGLADKGVFGLIRSFFGMLPIILLVGALYLLFDDLFTMFTGGESITGSLIDTLFGIGTTEQVVESVTTAWHNFIDWLGNGGSDTLKMIARLVVGTLGSALNIVTVAVQELGYAFKFAFDSVAHSLKDADKDLAKMKEFGKTFGEREKFLSNWVMGEGSRVEVGKITAGPAPVLPGSAPAATPDSYAGVKGRPPVNVTINQQISGVSNPKEAGTHAGKMTKDALDKSLRDAMAAQPTGG